MSEKYIIFDLDDTLVYEIDFLKSAYTEIATILDPENHADLYRKMLDMYSAKQNVFESLSSRYSVSVQSLLERYRNHIPDIKLVPGAKEVLQHFRQKGYKLGLITDGRSVTQRNKLKALRIEEIFDKVVISEEFGSEKPDPKNFEAFIENEVLNYIYIADNPAKDFITPKKLGWKTICLLAIENNIHKQNFQVDNKYLPHHKINNITEVLNYI